MRPAALRPGGAVRALPRALLLAAALTSACETTPDRNPMATLGSPDSLPTSQRSALETLKGTPSPEYVKVLRRVITQPDYTEPVREEAFMQLKEIDPAALKECLDVSMPRLQALQWRRRLCELYVQFDMKEMTPTLINAWAYPIAGWVDTDTDRPEYIALQKLHGTESVPDVLFTALLEANPVTQANLRARCWELLWKTGNRERLVALVQDPRIKPDDAFLTDVRRCAHDLGILPRNREEILWLRELQQPSRSTFWRDAVNATGRMPAEVRTRLELRELPVAVAASRHRPELLAMTPETLYPMVEARVKSEGRRTYSPNFEGYSGKFTESLYQRRDELSWGDLSAMLLAMDMLEQPSVISHIFDLGDRDMQDRATEYGGVVDIDAQGRFQIIEFRPRVTGSDVRFEAPQEMFDRAYTSLFHFHNHAQAYDNAQYAGPHLGDMSYADATRANCLVFTFIDRSTLNVDFYRYNRMVVDLGVVKRPGRS